MGSSLHASPALSMAMIFFVIFAFLCVLPELALAKHAGVTRHYKFNVLVRSISFTICENILVKGSSGNIFVCLLLCADQVSKCDETLSDKEHCDREWAVSGA